MELDGEHSYARIGEQSKKGTPENEIIELGRFTKNRYPPRTYQRRAGMLKRWMRMEDDDPAKSCYRPTLDSTDSEREQGRY